LNTLFSYIFFIASKNAHRAKSKADWGCEEQQQQNLVLNDTKQEAKMQ
jgi:hypothetical protein